MVGGRGGSRGDGDAERERVWMWWEVEEKARRMARGRQGGRRANGRGCNEMTPSWK